MAATGGGWCHSGVGDTGSPRVCTCAPRFWHCLGREAAAARWRIGVNEQPDKPENGLGFILFYSLCLGNHRSPVEGVFG